MGQLKLVWLLAIKDLKIEYRSRQAFLTTLFFAALILVVFNFAFDPGSASTRDASPGILWVALLFPGMIQLNRSFQSETEEGTLQGIVLAPVDRGILFLGKVLANWLFLLAIDLLILAVFIVFFNFAPDPSFLWVILFMFLVGAGFSAVGTVFAAMVTNVRIREVLLPILLFPIIVPIILAAVNATREVLIHQDFSTVERWLQLVVAFDVIFLAAGFLVFDYVVGE
ncbi:MAG TPA: heme exporter protein CcmB [Acidobacteriota bacterium]|nr:heme exporter protein CcmB [Acidobacteriota bacterium]